MGEGEAVALVGFEAAGFGDGEEDFIGRLAFIEGCGEYVNEYEAEVFGVFPDFFLSVNVFCVLPCINFIFIDEHFFDAGDDGFFRDSDFRHPHFVVGEGGEGWIEVEDAFAEFAAIGLGEGFGGV